MLGLGKLQHLPPEAWMSRCLGRAQELLGEMSAEGLAALVWGVAALGYVPDKGWLRWGWLGCQGGALAALSLLLPLPSSSSSAPANTLGSRSHHPPDHHQPPHPHPTPHLPHPRRALAGMVQAKIRAFLPPALSQLLEGLSRMGYKPRPEICLSLLGQARRHMHAFSPAQLAVLLHSIGAYGSWRPYRTFLFDFVTHSRDKLGSWSAAQAADVAWSFARFK
jgi:hypothetical protein